MRRQLEQPAQGIDEVEEKIDRMEQEEEAQRQQEGMQGQQPQEQATMFDLVQEMRNMNQNLQAFQIETRGQYEDMNTRLGRVERGLRAIHDYIGVEKSMRKAKKNIGSKNGLEKACKSGDFTKKEECEVEKRSYSHRIGANLDFLEI
ncbi:hypothetical protein PIB30_051527 [Stylosanthes scabra]|uniref:Uncharacterized protein n=1 Tax=Stylosanthes scabra TaxID=79078 RepID=A0ABU6UHS0_9FABA|nr:hypothetical protein [Stylosanthes scabra]